MRSNVDVGGSSSVNPALGKGVAAPTATLPPQRAEGRRVSIDQSKDRSAVDGDVTTSAPSLPLRPSPLHLVVYSDANALAGAERCLANLLGTLGSHVRVTVMGTNLGLIRQLAAHRAGTDIKHVPPVSNKFDVRAIVAHVRAMRDLRPDVVHANLRHPWSCQYGLVAGLLTPGAQVVAVEQLPLPAANRIQRRMKQLVSSRLDAHVAVGHRAARIIEELASLPAGSVRTIYNGVPDVTIAQSRPPHDAASGPVAVVTVGRLVLQKGIDVLLRALPHVPGITVTIVGDGPERVNLERLAAELGLADRLTFTGWIDDPRWQLDSFDVFVLPSRFEGFPLSVVEAMLARLPVVAADVGSVSESVVAGVTGLLVAPDNPGALAAALRELVDDEPRRARLGDAGRRLALDRFTSASMARAYERLYIEMTWRRPCGGIVALDAS